jgi:hypothetical protein
VIGVSNNSLGTFVNDTLGVFGIKGGQIGAFIDTLTGNSIGQLQNLHDAYMEQAQFFGTGPISRRMNQMMMGGMAGGYMMPSPMAMMPHMGMMAGGMYAGGGAEWMDMAPGSTNIPILSKLFSPFRRMSGQFERALRHNPALRMQFESQIGGRIVDFGFRNDGKMKIQRFGGGYMPNMAMFSPFAGHIFGHMGAMNTASMGMFGAGAMGMFGGNPFNGFMMGGLANVAGFHPGAFPGANYGSQGVSGAGWSPFDNSGHLGGRGFGSWNPFAMPGHINNTNPAYESAHQAQGAAILADPSLTVEDQVVLLLMLIMKKADDDIKRQAQYVNSIQQQQSRRGNQGGGGLLGGFFGNMFGGGILGGLFGGGGGLTGGGNDAPSIDVETMKLKRMIDKRSQMFDMLRQIIDKYNQTAKSMIDSIGR